MFNSHEEFWMWMQKENIYHHIVILSDDKIYLDGALVCKNQ